MRTRAWLAEDTTAVQRIHEAMETGYRLPDLDAPLFGLKRVVTAENGEVIGAGAVKPIGECFLWVAQTLPPVLRARAFRRLMGEARNLAAVAGYDELTAWIPPHIQLHFSRALSHAGWTMSPWQSWSTKL